MTRKRELTVYSSSEYFIHNKTGEITCQHCVDSNKIAEYGETINDMTLDMYWEGEPLICGLCEKPIESAYGVPDSD